MRQFSLSWVHTRVGRCRGLCCRGALVACLTICGGQHPWTTRSSMVWQTKFERVRAGKRLPECEKAIWRTRYSASCASVGGCGVSQPSHPRQGPGHEQTAVACPSAELGAQNSIAHLSCSECLVHSTSAHKWTRGVSGVPCSRQAATKGCSLKETRML